MEGSYDAQLGDGSVLTPIVEAGMRYDAGHAEEGFGAELGGGVRYVKPEWGLDGDGERPFRAGASGPRLPGVGAARFTAVESGVPAGWGRRWA